MKKALMAGFLIAMFLVIAGVFAGIAHGAEINAGEIYIQVQDDHGNAIQNATVEIISNTSQIIAQGKTNHTGIIIFSGLQNFTGEIKISKDGYKDVSINITYSQGKAYSYIATLHSSGYISKAKSLYDAHKTAIIAGGVVIFFVLILLVIGNGKRVRW